MRIGIFTVVLLGACTEELESPSPALDSVEPALACNEQFISTLTVNGQRMTPLPVDLATPEPQLILPHLEASKISELDGSAGTSDAFDLIAHTRWLDANTMEIDIDPEMGLPDGAFGLNLENADGQRAELNPAMAIVPPPTASAIAPDRVCLDQGDVSVSLTGEGFLVVDGVLPTVDIGGTTVVPDGAEDCFDIAAAAPSAVQSCNALPVTLAQDLLTEGLYDVILTNPEPAACLSTEALTIQVFPAPTLDSIEPVLDCDDGVSTDNTYVLRGQDFLVIDGVNPTVIIGPFSAEASAMLDCASDPNGGADQICSTIEIDVPTGTLPLGLHPVAVQNPPPVGCTSAEDVSLELIGPPVITGFDPTAACETADTDTTVTVEGAGFLFLDVATYGYQTPTIEMTDGSGNTLLVWTDDPSHPEFTNPGINQGPAMAGVNCASLLGDIPGEVCDDLVITLPATVLGQGSYPVTVTNPLPADCADSSASAVFDVVAPPEITDVQPQQICDNGQSFTIFGNNFISSSEVFLDGVEVVAAGGTTATNAGGTQIDVTLPPGFGSGVFDVTVSNGSGCEVTFPAGLEIVDLPIVFFVDPPVMYNQISIQASIYVSGVNGGIQSVTLEEVATGVLTPITDFTWDPLEPGRIQAVIPAFLPEGDYNVQIIDDLYCDPSLEDALFQEADLTVSVDAIDPPFGWTSETTATEITGGDPAAFQNVPRLYLNPVNASGTDTGLDTGLAGSGGQLATELRGVDFKDGDTLNAVVPDGLPVDNYDVLVINPDGAIGLLPSGFQIVPEATPIIDSVSPGTLPNGGDEPAVIYGSGFLNPRVEVECTNPNTGAFDLLQATVVSSTLNQIDILFPAGDLSDGGGVCLVVVYSDYTVGGTAYTTFGKYAAVSVTNPSQNLYDWRPGTDLITPRRAPAAAAGRSTRIARNVYAIGGDDGFGLTYSSIERAPVGQFGDLSPWVELPARQELPDARTLTAPAQLGRYIYLAGGNDGFGTVNSVWRAQILDPLKAPQISTNLGLELGTIGATSSTTGGLPPGLGLAGGTYVYRISALFDATYDDNPNGESLASDPFVVRVPDRAEGILLTLSWDPVPGAAGYRIYRSVAGSGFEERLAEVAAVTSFMDDGTASQDPSVTPLPQGALGAWEALPILTTPREGACASIAFDPTSPGDAYLYVGGGMDEVGTVLDTVEYLPIREVDEWDHEVLGGWTTSLFALPGARWQCQAFTATSELNPSVTGDDTWIVFGGGLDPTGGIENAIDGRLVGPGGEFQTVGSTTSDMKGQAGYVIATASDFFYSLGGDNAGPTNNGVSAEMCFPGKSGCQGLGLPKLKNWNALGTGTLLEGRYLSGSAQESSVIFAIGGDDGTGATVTTEFTNY